MLAGELAAGRRVLDLGCGQGYGTAFLARTAASVVGVDIDPGVVAAAQKTYRGSSAKYTVGDATSVLLPDDSVDLVVCFEVLEHVSEPGLILDEAARVLAPGGLLIISTPDAASSTGDNHFHLHEMSATELSAQIEKRFEYHQLWCQRVTAASILQALDSEGHPAGAPTSGRNLDWTPEDMMSGPEYTETAPTGTVAVPDVYPATPLYLVALCSDNDLADSVVLPGLLVDPQDALLVDLRHQQRQARQQLDVYEAELELRARTLANADADVARARVQLAAYETELSLKNHQLGDLQARLVTFDSLTEQVAASEDKVAETAKTLQQAQGTVNRLLDQATQRARSLRTAQDAAQAAKLELLSERTSLAGQILGNYRHLIESWLPPSSRRRRTYSKVHDVARRITGRRVRESFDRSRATTRIVSPFSIELTIDPQPQVSIVIPTYGNAALTLQCLAAIADAPTAIGYEVIVVDDASPDGSAAVLANVGGITLIENPVNSGYLRSTNIGAARSSAEFVVLLNSDTEVTAGWLDALVRAARDPSVGAVGASLRYGDGTLQEAGGIVFSDGSAWNFGRHGQPDDSRYQNRREVDYCSAACLLVRRSAWEVLDGFDPLYEPAYYEDTDLCFRLREISLAVMYEPEAVVIHHEGSTHGTDQTEVGRQLRETNSAKFIARWQQALTRQQPPGAVFRARRRGSNRTILVIDHRLPTPDRDSGSVRMIQWLMLLQAAGRHVVFIPQNATLYPQYLQPLRDLDVEVLLPDSDIQSLLGELGPEVDLVVLSRPDIAADYLPRVRKAMPHAIFAYDMVDFHGLREQRRLQLGAQEHRSQQGREPQMAEIERDMMTKADLIVAISAPEAEQVRATVSNTPVLVIPNIHAESPLHRTFVERNGFVFVGGFDHPPNRDAVHHLVQQIWPLIRRELPTAELHLVGSQMPADISDLGGGGVIVHGWLPDLTPILAASRVFLAPLRYGAGLKGKVGQAMGLGIPVVTTSIGAEGMSGAPLVVADHEIEFAQQAISLHADSVLWQQQVDAASTYIAERFSPVAVAPMVTEFLAAADRLVQMRTPTRRGRSGR